MPACNLEKMYGNGGVYRIIDVLLGNSELKQIEIVSNVDLSPLWNMATYHDEEIDVTNERIDDVLEMVRLLVVRLNRLDNLQTIIEPYEYDIDFEYYFSGFSKDRGCVITDNNFGQNLKNLQHFLSKLNQKERQKFGFTLSDKDTANNGLSAMRRTQFASRRNRNTSKSGNHAVGLLALQITATGSQNNLQLIPENII